MLDAKGRDPGQVSFYSLGSRAKQPTYAMVVAVPSARLLVDVGQFLAVLFTEHFAEDILEAALTLPLNGGGGGLWHLTVGRGGGHGKDAVARRVVVLVVEGASVRNRGFCADCVVQRGVRLGGRACVLALVWRCVGDVVVVVVELGVVVDGNGLADFQLASPDSVDL
jgi:hypothetical protein